MENLKPSQIVILASGALLLLFSFFEQAKDEGNAWKEFGLGAVPPIIGIIAVAAIALPAFVNVTIPERILTLRINQWILVLGLAAVLISIGLWRIGDNNEVDLTAFFWLYLLSTIGLVVGAVMDLNADDSPAATSGTSAPTPF